MSDLGPQIAVTSSPHQTQARTRNMYAVPLVRKKAELWKNHGVMRGIVARGVSGCALGAMNSPILKLLTWSDVETHI